MLSDAAWNFNTWLSQARAGDATAWQRLVDQYRHYLPLLTRLQLGRAMQAKLDTDDLVQEVFLRAWENLDQFRGATEAELVAWLRQILANCLAKAIRRYRGTQARDVLRERRLSQELEESSRAIDQGLAVSDSSPSRQAARREQGVLLANALQQLPEHYREVLILRHLEGLTFPAVARRMGKSTAAIEGLWARALRRLRKIMGA
jgi:RNA polymerase sigma-70 factor (ECF subfamily)